MDPGIQFSASTLFFMVALFFMVTLFPLLVLQKKPFLATDNKRVL